MKALLLVFAVLVFSGVAHASGAVEYSCAGYEPNLSGKGPLSNQAVIFNMISANGGIDIEVVKKSNETVDPKNAGITIGGKDCEFTMEPDDRDPAYRVSVYGKCGTAVVQNFKGICYFDL